MTHHTVPRPGPNVRRIFTCLWIVALVCACVTNALSQSLYQQNFNQETIQLSDGAQLGPDASGASGKAGDRSYLAETSALPKAVAIIPSKEVPDGAKLEELTVTAWYKPSAELADATTLFSALGTVLIWDNAKKHWVWRVEAAKIDGSQGPYWFYLSSPPVGAWVAPGEWTFIALVWNKAEGVVRFYQGNSGTEPKPRHEIIRREEVEPLVIEARKKNTIGNDRLKTDRAFGGNIDNVRFFGKVLDESAIEAIYKADLANEQPALP